MIFQMFKLVLEKAEEPEIKMPTSTGSWKKQESSRKTSTSVSLTMLKPLISEENNCASVQALTFIISLYLEGCYGGEVMLWNGF